MKNFLFIALLLFIGCKSADLVSPEVCASQVERYMKVNLLKADKLAEEGIDLSSCCESKDFQECAWNQVSTAYNFEFDKAVFDTVVIAFLKDHRIGDLHFLMNVSDINGCVPDHQKIKKEK